MLAIAMAKNEADIISRTVTHLFDQGVDRVVVADNLSTDDTAAIARRAGALVVQDEDPAYRQADKMTALAMGHAEIGEFVIPFDADELWWNLEFLTDEIDIATAKTHVHIGEKRVLGWERLPKVAFRWVLGAHLTMGNHSVKGAGPLVADGLLEVCHYQYRTLEQVRRKVTQGVAAYNLTDLPTSDGLHWRTIAAYDDEALQRWWDDYTTQPLIDCEVQICTPAS